MSRIRTSSSATTIFAVLGGPFPSKAKLSTPNALFSQLPFKAVGVFLFQRRSVQARMHPLKDRRALASLGTRGGARAVVRL